MAESKRSSGEACRDSSPNSRPADSSDALRVRRSQRNTIDQPQTASQGSTEDFYSNKVLQDVFGECRSSSPVEGASCLHPSRKHLSLPTLDTFISESLKEVTRNELKASLQGSEPHTSLLTHSLQSQQAEIEGRLGPAESTFDILTSVGILLLDPDKLGITSHSNFSSIKGNCCVYEGKWVYELMLVSKGVMQLGWCTSKCRFTQEEGVGDTRDSYAYDGNRLRKWNITTKKYGEPWMSGDVISCAIDCDEGTISFYRNGVFLGEAFDKLRMGPGYAYFPANPRLVEVAQAELLFTYLHSLLPKVVEDDQVTKLEASGSNLKEDFPLPPLSDQCPQHVVHTIVASHIFHKLAPLLRIPYVVEMCLVKFMLGLCDHDNWNDHQPYVHKLLDLLWMLMQDQEMQECMDNLTVSLLNGYSFHSFHPEFKFPKKFLALTLSVLRHQRTRRYLLTSVLYPLWFSEYIIAYNARIKFPVFMHIKAPDDPNLARLIPNVWWDKTLKKEEDDGEDEQMDKPEETPAEKMNRKKFELCCERLGERIQELESMQVELLKCLLVNNDYLEGKTSRDLFLVRLKTFLRDHSTFNRPQVAQCSLPVILCFFHRLIQALRFYWDQTSVSSTEAFMPIQCFWNESRDYFELLRCGGLMSHLNRQLGSELNRAQGIEVQEDGKVVKKPVKDSASSKTEDDFPKLDPLLGSALEEILDCVVLLYHIAAHRQLGKMCALRESMLDFVVNLRDTERKIRKCPEELSEVKEYLEGAKMVFVEKIIEQARQMVWVEKVIYSPSKQADLAWLLGVVLKTVEKASQYNRLFQYIPEFYIETAVNAFNALRNYMHPTTSFHEIQGLPNLLNWYARFLVNHFFDSRLVNNDLKDTLVQALACFTCYPDTLKILEEMPMENRILMIQSLISPYENRSWAHTNWILVRIWKGCGFGYRYRYLPNLIPHKAQPTEFSYVSLQKPCPSQEFQSLLAKILLDDESRSTKFLDSLMNQLNWSFSEFVGIIQDIQSQGSRTEPLMLEPRQVKICAACFEISVCLLRVLEMVATVAPQVFTDWSRPSAELFLKRLMQLLSQIMSRVTMKEGPFENTVALPIHGLDTVTFYPILTVTVGIMAQLIVRCGGSSQEKATRSLLLDSSFSLDSLKFVLGENMAIRGKPDKAFSFRKFDEISVEEMEDVEKLFSYLSQQQVSLTATEEVVKDEELCTICYANRQQAVFVPCGHKSCRTCITQQLLNKKECFFCISPITRVNDLKGRQILREYFQSTAAHRKT
ncbi:hypothetical protein RRG08_054806 [Elysia crispata]|uniref:E3 ubiquitin-protein ligase RNF123 n=1 Tax=Elysia crispata TaxID=231223 RepID=A0AAE1CXY5_9GAST|nr:hypothetical protein RRG08_054806 [Elysia crispata]